MYAIGSNYLIRQTGSDRFDGVTVKIRPRTSTQGKIEVSAVDWRTEEPVADDVSFLIEAAIAGIKSFAKDNDFDLNGWDIMVWRFAYHPVDSSARATQIAAYNAIASALASWHSIRVQFKHLKE